MLSARSLLKAFKSVIKNTPELSSNRKFMNRNKKMCMHKHLNPSINGNIYKKGPFKIA